MSNSGEIRQAILDAIAAAPAPLAAAQLARQHKVKPAQIHEMLADDIAAGGVFSWDKGRKYWHRDPQAVARENIFKAIEESAEPVAAATLKKLAKPGDLPTILAADLAAGRLFTWGNKLFWSRDFRVESRERILKAIADAAEPIAPTSVANLAWKLTSKDVAQLLAPDIADGRVFAWSKGKLYWHRDARSVARGRLIEMAMREDYTKEALLERVIAESPRIEPKEVKAALAALLKDRALVPVLKPLAPIHEPVAETVQQVADKMFEAINQIAFAPGTTVTFYRLRQQPELAQLPKKIFDEAALRLQEDRRALLTAHGHASALTPAEREELVTDGLGTYYASIYAR